MASGAPLVGVVNFGVGTWTSVVNMLESIGVDGQSCTDPQELDRFTHLILPGVGNFSAASSRLDALGWRQALIDSAARGTPLLGICLGMQLLGSESQEGEGTGLNLLDFLSEQLSTEGPLRTPHIGWNTVEQSSNHPIFKDWTEDSRFYFVHSFAVSNSCPDSIGTTSHNQPFTSIVAKKNIVGVQFHPEKSHKHGQTLLSNFVEMGPQI
jgi:imidazole glycerol-phosphate synthase subunit HisH